MPERGDGVEPSANPGLLSSWLYLADAALLIGLLWIFRDGWTADPARWSALAAGVILGVIFIVVIPILRFTGKVFPRRARLHGAQASPCRTGLRSGPRGGNERIAVCDER